MATVITGVDYKAIADTINDARTIEISGANAYYLDAVEVIVQMATVPDDIYPEVDLLTPFWNAYQVSLNKAASTSDALDAVRALQAHVVNRGGTTVDAYLLANGLTVHKNFADLSAAVGYTIAPAYIVTP